MEEYYGFPVGVRVRRDDGTEWHVATWERILGHPVYSPTGNGDRPYEAGMEFGRDGKIPLINDAGHVGWCGPVRLTRLLGDLEVEGDAGEDMPTGTGEQPVEPVEPAEQSEQTLPDLANVMVQTTSERESEQVQQVYFDRGHRWRSGHQNYLHNLVGWIGLDSSRGQELVRLAERGESLREYSRRTRYDAEEFIRLYGRQLTPMQRMAQQEANDLSDQIGGRTPRPACECQECRVLATMISRRDALQAFVQGNAEYPEEDVFGAPSDAEPVSPDDIFGARVEFQRGQRVRPICPPDCSRRGGDCEGRSERGVTIREISGDTARFEEGGSCPISALQLIQGGCAMPTRRAEDDEPDGPRCPSCDSLLDGSMCEECGWGDYDDEGGWEDDDDDEEEDDPIEETQAPNEENSEMAKNLLITEKNLDTVLPKIKVMYGGIPYMRELKSWHQSYGKDARKLGEALAAAVMSLEEAGWGNDNPRCAEDITTLCDTMPQMFRVCDRMNHGMLTEIKKKVRMIKPKDENATRFQVLGLIKNFRKAWYIDKDNAIAVETDDCIAKDVNFGPFLITYWLDSGHLRLKALRPNVPQGRGPHVVHPHVDRQNGDICLGNGSNAFGSASRDGRFCDALLVVRAVLNEYGGNPFHNIDNWKRSEVEKLVCVVCGSNASSRCRGCQTLMCATHTFKCTRCGASVCHDHVQRCRDCNNVLCGPCRREEKTCGVCHGKSAAVKRGEKPSWSLKAAEYKGIVAKAARKAAPKKATVKTESARLGGGFLE